MSLGDQGSGAGGGALLTQAIIGYRGWWLETRTGTTELTGQAFRQRWVPGENEAVCYNTSDDMMTSVGIPGLLWQDSNTPLIRTGISHLPCTGMESTCSCGFYAYHVDPSEAPHLVFDDFDQVEGVIEGYGRVILGPHGFRASKARVVGFVQHPAPESAELFARFNVPVYATRAEALEAWPVQDLSHLIGGEDEQD